MLKVLGKIDLNNVGKDSTYYAKYIPLYRDEGCSCHYGYNCDEPYDFMKYPIGYIKVDIHGNFIADVNEDRQETFIHRGEIHQVNHDWLRKLNYRYNDEAFKKYSKPKQDGQ